MSNVLDDLRKARLAAVQNRRALACRLKGVWLGQETHETLENLVLTQQALEAIDAAIAHDEGAAEADRRRASATVINFDDGYEEMK